MSPDAVEHGARDLDRRKGADGGVWGERRRAAVEGAAPRVSRSRRKGYNGGRRTLWRGRVLAIAAAAGPLAGSHHRRWIAQQGYRRSQVGEGSQHAGEL